MTIINQSVYPGIYDPNMVKSLLEDNIKGVVVYPDRFAASARDLVIGSVHVAFDMKPIDPFVSKIETAMRQSGYRTKYSLSEAIDNDQTNILKELYSNCTETEHDSATAHIAVFFDVPSKIMKETEIKTIHLFRSLKVEDPVLINEGLLMIQESTIENFMQLGLSSDDSDSVVMYWAPWPEVSVHFAN